MMLYFLLPAFNEENNISLVVNNIDRQMKSLNQRYRIVIVDDGSQDKTREVVSKLKNDFPIELLPHQTNYGVDQAFKTGFDFILPKAKPQDLVVSMEADNTSDLSILPAMLGKVGGETSVVLASCYAREGKVVQISHYRKLLSAGANFLLKLFFPIKRVNTYSSFYRVYRAETLQKVFQVPFEYSFPGIFQHFSHK